MTNPSALFTVRRSRLDPKSYAPHAIGLFGMPGSGKSTFLRSVVDEWGENSLIVLETEGRGDEQGYPHIVLPSFDNVLPSMRADKVLKFWDILLTMAENVEQAEIKYENATYPNAFSPEVKVFAIDTLDVMYRVIENSRFAKLMNNKPEEEWKIPFTAYSPIYTEFLKRVERTVRLKERGLTVILTMHMKPELEEGSEVRRIIYQPAMRPGLIGPILYKTTVNLTLAQRQGRLVNTLVTTSEGGVYPSKDGSGRLPAELPATWKAYVAAMTGNYEPGDPQFEPNLPHLTRQARKESKRG